MTSRRGVMSRKQWRRWVTLLILCLTVCVFVLACSFFMQKTHTRPQFVVKRSPEFLVHTSGCSIPDMNAFDESILSFIGQIPDVQCNQFQPSVTYQDELWLRINRSQFVSNGVSNFSHCEFSVISRAPNSDWEFSVSKPIRFDDDMEVSDEFLTASCYNTKGERKYKNYHAFPLPYDVVRPNKTFTADTTRSSPPPNVLFVGIDSISRLNMVRQLNRTRGFLVDNLGSTEFYGYTKVGDHTFVNIVPILTGKFISEIPFNENTMGKKHVDNFGYIWHNFSDKGYLTLFAEDAPGIATFNYLKVGFRAPPTDYYLRPFSLAMEKDPSLRHNINCFADRVETEIVMDYLSDFLETNQNSSFFAYIFLSRPTHGNLNAVGGLDNLYFHFFETIQAKGHLENTILFFFSDHGIRFGGIRNTYIGKMEERLPMMIMYLPPTFKHKHPQATNNVKQNSRRLTTPFDVHSTLRDILDLNFGGEADSDISGRGISFFTEVSTNRTCEAAEIPPHYCTCQSQEEVNVTDPTVQEATNFTLAYINHVTNTSKCAELQLKAVLHAWRSFVNFAVLKHIYNLNGKQKSVTDYQIMFEAVPGGGQFEATVRQIESKGRFMLTGEISRINLYGTQSHCVNERRLKKFCYCV